MITSCAGFFVPPTILTDVPTDAAGWSEEIFGPVLCVRPFETEDEAVASANASAYGLAHAVFSADEQRCARTENMNSDTRILVSTGPEWPLDIPQQQLRPQDALSKPSGTLGRTETSILGLSGHMRRVHRTGLESKSKK